jgi:penicillin-binding protein 1A
VKTLIDVGWDTVVEVAQKMGIESKLNPTYSMALGGSEVNLLELTSAYGALAAEGVHTKAHGIRRIRDRRGNVIYDENFKGEQALDKESAAIMTWMLRGVVNDGTGRAAQLGRPVAGKTGTSDEARDLWFVGYIPQLVTGVWLGNDDNKPTNGASGTAAYTWHQFMVKVVQKMNVEPFPERPKDIENRKGSIKPKPIKSNRAQDKARSRSESTSRSDSNRASGNRASESSSTEYRSSRRRWRSEESYSQPEPERYSRRREPVEEAAPRYSERVTRNPDAQNVVTQNPDAQNAVTQNPDAQNAVTQTRNPDAQNAVTRNRATHNPDVQNAATQNRATHNPDVQSAGKKLTSQLQKPPDQPPLLLLK